MALLGLCNRNLIRSSLLPLLPRLSTIKAPLSSTCMRIVTSSRSLLSTNDCCVGSLQSRSYFNGINTNLLKSPVLNCTRLQIEARRFLPTLNQIRRKKPRTKKKRAKVVVPLERRILLGPQRKGVCVKCVVRTPRKPNSAQRKCAVLRLNDGRLITAYIPGEKSNLQEHGVVLFRGGRVQDCPGLKYKIIRGVYDMN